MAGYSQKFFFKCAVLLRLLFFVARTELNIYMYPSRIYKILNVLEPFSYASYLVFVCESNALFEYDSRPITP